MDMNQGRLDRARRMAILAAEKIEKPRGYYFPRSSRIVVENPETGEMHCISPCSVPPDWETDVLFDEACTFGC